MTITTHDELKAEYPVGTLLVLDEDRAERKDGVTHGGSLKPGVVYEVYGHTNYSYGDGPGRLKVKVQGKDKKYDDLHGFHYFHTFFKKKRPMTPMDQARQDYPIGTRLRLKDNPEGLSDAFSKYIVDEIKDTVVTVSGYRNVGSRETARLRFKENRFTLLGSDFDIVDGTESVTLRATVKEAIDEVLQGTFTLDTLPVYLVDSVLQALNANHNIK